MDMTTLELEQNTTQGVTIQNEEISTQPETTADRSRERTAAERVAEAFSSLNNPITNPSPSHAEIIQPLVINLQRQADIRTYWMMLLSVLCLTVGIICFIIPSHTADSVAISLTSSVFGVLFVMIGFGIFMFSLLIRNIHRRQPVIVGQGFVRYVMRIEGDQWKRFLDYFYSGQGRPSGFRRHWISCAQNKKQYERLLTRGHGHIILGSLGFIIDELYCTTYVRHIVLKTGLLQIINGINESTSEPIIDTVVRIWLCRRVYNARWGPPTPFKVDIFLASEVPGYQIPGIVKYIVFG